MDGESLEKTEDLNKIGILELENVIKLDNSYLRLKNKVKKMFNYEWPSLVDGFSFT